MATTKTDVAKDSKTMSLDEAAKVVEAKTKREREEAQAAEVLAVARRVAAQERERLAAEKRRAAELAEAVATVEALEAAAGALAPLSRAGLYRSTGGSDTATRLPDAVSHALGLAGEHLKRLNAPDRFAAPAAMIDGI